jgi:hypothetical protein
MLQFDKERAAKLAEVLTAQELDILTDWIMSRDKAFNQSAEDRLEDIIWEASEVAQAKVNLPE